MDTSKTHQEQNTILAKTVNVLKIELRQSKQQVHSLRNQLQSSLEQNIQLAEQQANLFNSIEQFEMRLDQVFANNSFSYLAMSTSIQQITAQNPKRSELMRRSIDVLNHSVNESMCSVQSNATTYEKPSHQSAQHVNEHDDIFNTAFRHNDSDYASDESIQMPAKSSLNSKIDNRHGHNLSKMPSRIPVPDASLAKRRQSAGESLRSRTYLRQRRSTKKIDYREQPINRKMRRSH